MLSIPICVWQQERVSIKITTIHVRLFHNLVAFCVPLFRALALDPSMGKQFLICMASHLEFDHTRILRFVSDNLFYHEQNHTL